MNNFGYDEFHKMCLDIRTKNRTFITRRNCSYIVCCKNFLRDCVQIEGVEKLIKRLKGRCLFFFMITMITFAVLRESMTFPKWTITASLVNIQFYLSLVKNYMFFFPLLILVENNSDIL